MLYETSTRWMLPALLACAWLVASCAMLPVAPAPAPAAPVVEEELVSHGDVAMANLRTLLAIQLQVAPETVEVVAAEPVTWPDACLGAGTPQESCALVETPGHKISLRVEGQVYTYHTDQQASWVRLVAGPAPEVGDAVMAWMGTVDNGSCQEATIGAGGVAFGICGGMKLGGKFVSPARQATLARFAERYAAFEATTDAGTLRFAGRGAETASPATQLQLATWAQLVVMEANSGMPFGSLTYAAPAEPGAADGAPCATLTIGAGEVTVAGCDGAIQTVKLNGGPLNQWLELQDRLAPFVYENGSTTLHFVGMGAEESPAWQRAMLASAQAMYSQFTSGQVSAAGNTALSWTLGPLDDLEAQCMHLTVLTWGYAQAEMRPCAGGDIQAMQTGWLETGELEQLDTWLYRHAPLQAEQGYVAGAGSEAMDERALAAVEQWASGVWLRLWGVASPQDVIRMAGGESCAAHKTGGQLFWDDAAGYCLVFPAEYVAERTAPNTMAFVHGSLMNHTDPRVTVEVSEAAGRTQAEVGEAIAAGYPGFELPRSKATVGGIEALVLDNLPGQDLSRHVVMVREGRLYTLAFTPLGETAAAQEAMDVFYARILGSFAFLD